LDVIPIVEIQFSLAARTGDTVLAGPHPGE
jgi:hypothetical protein